MTTTVDPTTGEIIPAGFEDTIELARQALGAALTEMQKEALGADRPADVARALAAMRDLKADAGTVYRDIEEHLLGCWDGDYYTPLEVVGQGQFKVHRRTQRKKWDHDALVQDVLEVAETDAGEDLTARDAVRELRECIGFGAGKVGGIKARGLQVDQYCEVTEDGHSIELPPRDHGQDVA